MGEPTRLSKNKVDKAGKYLRDLDLDPTRRSADPARLQESLNVITEFRDGHAYPMQKVRYGLASFVNTDALDGAVSQRHKRVPRILRKLRRLRDGESGGSGLYRLEDIGGCRVVLGTPSDLEQLETRLNRRWGKQVTRRRDYIADPKEMGYRAKHIVVHRDGYAIEIQLRTRGQQDWADAIEKADSRFMTNLKDEDGPEELKDYFRAAGLMIYLGEFRLPIDPAARAEFNRAREAVVHAGYYTR